MHVSKYLFGIVALVLFACTPTNGAVRTKMPVGNLDSWRQVFTEDFSVDVGPGGFPGTLYKNKWDCYSGFNTTDKRGRYDEKIITIDNGILSMYIHTNKTTGISYSAAPVPLVNQNGTYGGLLYGRFETRFRSDSLPRYKTAWLLWPDSNNWTKGEVDFPEGNLDGTMNGFSHCTDGDPSKNCFAVSTKTNYSDWHIATIEWAPTYLAFILDDVVVGRTNRSSAIPTSKMHWVMQTETWYAIPDPNVAGNVQIDWAVMYAYDPTAVGTTTSATATTTPGTTSGTSGTSSGTPGTTGTAGTTGTTGTTTGTVTGAPSTSTPSPAPQGDSGASAGTYTLSLVVLAIVALFI